MCGGSYLSSHRARHMKTCKGSKPHTGGVINASEHEQPWDIVQSDIMQYG